MLARITFLLIMFIATSLSALGFFDEREIYSKGVCLLGMAAGIAVLVYSSGYFISEWFRIRKQ